MARSCWARSSTRIDGVRSWSWSVGPGPAPICPTERPPGRRPRPRSSRGPPRSDAIGWPPGDATGLANDPGGRLLRYQGMVLPEPAPGEAPPAAAGLNAAISGLKELLGEAPVDPLPGKLRELGQKGRVGAVVTRLELSPDLSSV